MFPYGRMYQDGILTISPEIVFEATRHENMPNCVPVYYHIDLRQSRKSPGNIYDIILLPDQIELEK
jgi:hypothetical protein